MILLVLTAFAIWLYLLSVLSRTKLYFFKFLVGAIGLFYFSMYFIEPYATKPLGNAVASVAGIPGKLTGLYEAFPQYSLIFISRENTFISFYIDYECSGIIEIIAFLALLWFFPLYDAAEKVVVSIVGFGWIFLANVIRIFVICSIISWMGNHVFYFAHTVFGRIVFYGLSVIMYFYVFTKAHVVRQTVGSFTYARNNDKTN